MSLFSNYSHAFPVIRRSIARPAIRRFCETSGPQHLLRTATDYVDKGVTFYHPKSDSSLRFSSNIDTCWSHKETGSSVSWIFWPASCIRKADATLQSFMGKRFMEWQPQQGMRIVSPEFADWARGCSRLFSFFPDQEIDHIMAGFKYYVSLAQVDAVIEEATKNRQRIEFVTPFIGNLLAISYENQDVQDLRYLRAPMFADMVTAEQIQAAELAQESWKSAVHACNEAYPPFLKNYNKDAARWWFEYKKMESRVKQKYWMQKMLLNPENPELMPPVEHPDGGPRPPLFLQVSDLRRLRCMTSGFDAHVAAFVNRNDMNLQLLNHFNTFIYLAGQVATFDTDILSFMKEGTDELDSCPFNYVAAYRKEKECSPQEAIQWAVNERNSMVEDLVEQVTRLPIDWQSVYQRILDVACLAFDTGLLADKGKPCPRYGFLWR